MTMTFAMLRCLKKTRNGCKVLRVPFTLYADFECILVPFQGCARDPNLAKPYTENVSLHVPSGFTLYIKLLHYGEDCVEVFCRTIKREEF